MLSERMDSLESRIIKFVAEFTGADSPVTLSTTLLGDLGVAGDDGDELLAAFGEQFGVDMSRCDPQGYFGTEGLPPWFPIVWLLYFLRRGSPEQRARLMPIRVSDLVSSARSGAWVEPKAI